MLYTSGNDVVVAKRPESRCRRDAKSSKGGEKRNRGREDYVKTRRLGRREVEVRERISYIRKNFYTTSHILKSEPPTCAYRSKTTDCSPPAVVTFFPWKTQQKATRVHAFVDIQMRINSFRGEETLYFITKRTLVLIVYTTIRKQMWTSMIFCQINHSRNTDLWRVYFLMNVSDITHFTLNWRGKQETHFRRRFTAL